MKNKIILSTGSLFFLSLEKIFKIAQQAGFNGIELMVDQTPRTRNVKLLKRLSKKYHLPILAVHAPHDKYDCFTQTAQGIVDGLTNLAKQLKVETMVVHPARIGLPQYAEDLKKVIVKNQEKNKICIENLPVNDRLCPQDQKYMSPKIVEKKYQRICLDTSHLATNDGDFKKLVKLLLPKIHHIHFSDNALKKKKDKNFIADTHLLPGVGKLPLTWVLKQLKNSKYRGYISIELLPENHIDKSPEDIVQDLCKSIKYIKDSI